MSRKSENPMVIEKEARIRELTEAALAMLEQGWSEEEIKANLRRTALYWWAPSYATLKVYVEAAMERAQVQFEQSQRRGEEGKQVNKSGA